MKNRPSLLAFFLTVFLLTSFFSFATTTSPIKGKVASKEIDPVSGKLKINVTYTVFDSLYIKDARFRSQARQDHPIFTSRWSATVCKV